MQIQRVEIYQLHWAQLKKYWHPVAVRLITDTGVSGFGEAGIAYGHGQTAAVAALKDLGQMLIHQDPLQIEHHWQRFYQHTFWAKSGGAIFYSAISALDCALWDLKGKALGVPVYELLGGQTNAKLRAYASQLQYGWEAQSRLVKTPAEFAQVAKTAVEEGYTAFKLDPLQFEEEQRFVANRYLLSQHQLQAAVERVAAVRETIGPNADLIVECHGKLEPQAAIQFAQRLAPLNIYYYEEPFSSLEQQEFATVAQHTAIPLATGERLTTRWQFKPFLEHQSVGIVQPDLGVCGGISEAVKIAHLASAYGVGVQFHTCGGPIATAATLQVEAAINNFVIHEEHEINLKPDNYQSGRFHYHPVDGYYHVPDRPGIGQALSEQAMEKAKLTVVE